jgi:iron(III) transport system permease protein
MENWAFLQNQLIPELLLNTVVLLSGSILLSTFIAILATVSLEMVGERSKGILETALTLPIVFPIYIYAFIYVGMFEWASPFSVVLRELGIFKLVGVEFISIKNIWGAIFIFSLALFPYIMIPLRLSIKDRWSSFFHTASLLGRHPVLIWVDIFRAYGKRAIIIGAVIVAMESISDFGGVSVIGVDTFTTAIYTSVTSFFSVEMAARLGFFLILFATIFLFIDSKIKEQYFTTLEEQSHLPTPRLPLAHKIIGHLVIAIILLFSIILPLVQLCVWAMNGSEFLDISKILKLTGFSLLLGVIGALIVVGFSLGMNFISRFNQRKNIQILKKFLMPFSLMGYAVPGNLAAVGILFIGVWIFPEGISYEFGFLLLIFGLCFRYMRTAFKQIELGHSTVADQMENTAYLLNNKDRLDFSNKVLLPLMNPYILYSFLFVMVEIIKEMPLTLLLRPMGLNTLATKIFELTSEGEWEQSALFTLPILLLCIVIHTSVMRFNSKRKKTLNT